MFLTQEKALKKISQERQKGDLRRALERARDGLSKFPDDYDIAMEAVQLCIDLADLKEAVTLMKSTIRRHPRSRIQLLGVARETLHQSFNPFLASFVVETLLHMRDIEDARDVFRKAPDSWISEMINRCQTRSKGIEGSDRGGNTENELLLGILLMESHRWEEAAAALGRALAASPDEVKSVGPLLLEIEREAPASAEVQFYLGLASTLLDHPEKAEARFFRSLELEGPPAQRIVELLQSAPKKGRDHLLLLGEALIVAGQRVEGIARIRRYIDEGVPAWDGEPVGPGPGLEEEAAPDPARLALSRLGRLVERSVDIETALLFAEVAGRLDRGKDAAAALEACYDDDLSTGERLVSWIGEHEGVRDTAPGQKLLLRLLIDAKDYSRAGEAARIAAELDPGGIPSMLEMIGEAVDAAPIGSGRLRAIQAELHARGGNGQRAGEIIRLLEDDGSIENDELLRLSGDILRHGGVNLEGVVSSIELGLRGGQIEGSLPFALEFYRQNPDAHGELAERVSEAAGSIQDGWSGVARLCDLIAAEEDLDRPMRVLRATAHLEAGEIERAVFEFDQLIMFDEALRSGLAERYERAAEAHPGNTMLCLALFQLHFEEEHWNAAAHWLGMALESDPGQIRDIMPRFEKIVEREPGNRGVWEEMLGTALRMSHYDLARELLRRAVQSLPQSDAAALHIFGAQISRSENRIDEALRCLAMTLSSPDANVRETVTELEWILAQTPDSIEARYLHGDALLRMSQEQQAMDEFERCIERSPAYRDTVRKRLEEYLPVSVMPWQISRLLAEIAWTQERYDDARRLLGSAQKGPAESLEGLGASVDRLRAVSPDDAGLRTIAARIYALTGRSDESVALLGPLAEDPASRPRVTAVLRELLGAAPRHAGANVLLARLLTAAGDAEGAQEALLRIARDGEGDPPALVGMLEEFLPAHGTRIELLVPLGGLRARAGDWSGALRDLRTALELDAASADGILEESSRADWPEEHRPGALLLEADCFTAGGFHRDAFRRLEATDAAGPGHEEEIMGRLGHIIELSPERDYYLFGGRLLSRSGEIEGAETLLRDGARTLGGEAAEDMMIALGEILEGAGQPARAAACLSELLDSTSRREHILRRIESAWLDWTRGEIEHGLRLIEAGEADETQAMRTARTALEAGDLEAASRSLEVCGRGLPAQVMRARLHLAAGRPLLALAAVRGAQPDGTDDALLTELHYIEGIVYERLGDHARAASAFARTVATGGFRDGGERALAAYTRYLGSTNDDPADVLVAVGDLVLGTGKEQS